LSARKWSFSPDQIPAILFAATYLAQAMLAVISGGVLMFLDIPVPPRRQPEGEGRPLREIARQPRFIVAVACGVASYSMMNLVMTSAPLAMVMCDHSVRDATLGLQWHVLGMFVPSFITGTLIARFGIERVIATGFALLITSAIISLTGITLWHFWIGLVLLGVGWNFGFIGATALVTESHRPNERNRVQAFNDFLVFGSMALGSFSSGKLLHAAGYRGQRGRVSNGAGGGRAAGLGAWRRRHALADLAPISQASPHIAE
jgi:MFS family permease